MAATQTRPWTIKCALILTPEHILCDHSKHKTCKVSRIQGVPKLPAGFCSIENVHSYTRYISQLN